MGKEGKKEALSTGVGGSFGNIEFHIWLLKYIVTFGESPLPEVFLLNG